MEDLLLSIFIYVLLALDAEQTTVVKDKTTSYRQKRHVTLCGEVVTKPEGRISPPTTDGLYLPNSYCRWELRAKQGQRLRISSTDFATEFSTGCNWDYLEVREETDDPSSRINKYCGYSPLGLLSSSGILFLYFVSDGSFQDRGFQLDFESVPQDFADPSRCNQLVQDEGVISSPNYPEPYSPYSSCFYWIKAPGEHTIRLELLDIRLEDSSCLFDYVKIHDGRDSYSPGLLDICGGSTPVSSVNSTGNDVFISFVSDGYLENRGFQIQVTFLKDIIMKSVDEKACHQVFNDSAEGIVTSPGFPGLYPNEAVCVTLIKSPLPDHHIQLTLTFLDVEGSTNCTFDSLEIFDGEDAESSSLGKICGQTIQKLNYFSTADTLKLVLTSDYLVAGKGFLGNFSLQRNEVSNCLPDCLDNQVCVEERDIYRCIVGKHCEYNICENGECVQQDGNLTCYCASNYTGTLCDVKIQVQEIQGSDFQFGIHETDLSVPRGGRFILDCMTNVSDTFFTWALNDRLVMGDDGVIEHNNGSLEILAFDDGYVGVYKCLTDSFDAFSQVTYNVTLLEGCNIAMNVSPEEVLAIRGDSATLRCEVEDGSYNITWLHNTEQLDGSKYQILDNGTTLTVSDITDDNAGEYRCVVSIGEDCQDSRAIHVSILSPQLDNGICGRPALPDMMPRMLGRISKGRSIQQGSSPWHVIMRDRREMTTFCGGTLISKSWVLTAAHCTSNDHFSREFNKSFDATYVDLFIGTDLCNGTGGEKRGIRQYIPYPRFGNRAPYDNDLALIELSSPVNYSRRIRPICLQSVEATENTFMNRRLGRAAGRVVGCGRVHERITEVPPYIRDVYVPYVDRRFCSHARIGDGNFTDSMFCAGYSRVYMGDACSGDSGGSLTMQRSEVDPWYLVGIVSWGVGCDRPGHYGYYTHVSKFLDWIRRVTKSEFLDPF